MDCKQCRELRDRYLDGQLPADVETAVEQHLDSCPDCRTLPDGRKLRPDPDGGSGGPSGTDSQELAEEPEGQPEPSRRERDLELAEGLRRRDPAAVKEIMTLYGDRLMRSAFLLCKSNEADAKDLVQDTFVLAVKSAHLYLGRSLFYTWLHGILLNVSRNFQRKQSRLIYTDDVPEQDVERPREPSGPELDITPAALTQALGELSDEHREVVVLFYFNGLNVPQIAQQTGVSLGTAKSRLHYAVKHLRQRLQKG